MSATAKRARAASVHVVGHYCPEVADKLIESTVVGHYCSGVADKYCP